MTKTVGSGSSKRDVQLEVSYYEIQFQKEVSSGVYVNVSVDGASPVRVVSPNPLPTNDAGIRSYKSPPLESGKYQFRVTGRDSEFPSGDGHTGWTGWSTFSFAELKKPTISFSALPIKLEYGVSFNLTAESRFQNAPTGLPVVLSLDLQNSAGCSLTPLATGGYNVSLDAATAAAATPTNGYCIINALQTASGEYDQAQATQAFSIAKATPTITLVGLPTSAVTYDGQEHGATGATVAGVAGENLTYSSIKYDDAIDPSDIATTAKPKDAGTYNVVAYFDETTNYKSATSTGSLTINPAALSITATATLATKTYDGTPFDPTTFRVAYSGFVNGESSSVLTGQPLQFDVTTPDADGHAYPGAGVYVLDLSGTVTARNYTITLIDGTLTITKAPLSVSALASPSSKVYDGNGFDATTFSVTYSGFVNNETADVIGGSPQYAVALVKALYLAPFNVSPYPGTYSLTASGLQSDNYEFKYSPATLTIGAWRFEGFYQPVDMTPAGATRPVYNTVKGGSTVPFKFEVFNGPTGATELRDLKVVNPLIAKGVPCNAATIDEIEVLSTGGTALRFDVSGDQFIYNWQTPRTPGMCYAVTVSVADGSTKTAYFQLK